jgi:hypothetical protein
MKWTSSSAVSMGNCAHVWITNVTLTNTSGLGLYWGGTGGVAPVWKPATSKGPGQCVVPTTSNGWWYFAQQGGTSNLLSGTFNVSNGSPNVTSTVSSVVSVGQTMVFFSQLGVGYTVQNVVGTAITLTSNYTGTNSSATNAGMEPNWLTTTISSASDGAVLPQSTINVVSTAGFPSSGDFNIINRGGAQNLGRIRYTGITSTSFTGCTGSFASGTLHTGYIIDGNLEFENRTHIQVHFLY